MSGERILVVDDGDDMRDFVVNYVIKPNGYEAHEACDGLDALQKIDDVQPDLILLDLQMPRLDGLGLLRRMRETDIHIPVVLMTFFGSEEIAIEVFRLGVRDYVIKPFTDDELLEAMERALVETRLRKEKETLQDQIAEQNSHLQSQIDDYRSLLSHLAIQEINIDALLGTIYNVQEVAAAAIVSIDSVSGAAIATANYGEYKAPYDTILKALESGSPVTIAREESEVSCLVYPISKGRLLCVNSSRITPSDHVRIITRNIAKKLQS